MLNVIKRDSFIENLLLLFVTIIITGVMIPAIFWLLDVARENRAAVSEAQTKLYNDLSEIILTYATLALDVSWYGPPDAETPQLQKVAVERYSDKVVELVSKWRVQISRAQT